MNFSINLSAIALVLSSENSRGSKTPERSQTFYLFAIVSSIGVTRNPEKSMKGICNKRLGDKSMSGGAVRKTLLAGIQITKGQWKNRLKYSCELEKLAGTLVTEPAGDVEGPYEVLTDAGPGILNLKDVVRKWKLQLQNMGEKRIVGCNYSLGKNRYKIACIFQ